MAKKKTGKKKMEETADATFKPVRLDLTPDEHHLLRRVAADDNKSMAAWVRDEVRFRLKEAAKKKGIK